MKLKLVSAVAAVALLGGVSSASASADVTVTYTGTITDGDDITGVFGPAGGSLDGDSFTFTYVFDPTLGATYSSSTENYAYGGSLYGSASPALSAVVTINRVTASIGVPSYFAQILGENNGSYSEQYASAQNYSDIGAVYINSSLYSSIYNYTATLPAGITGPLTYTTEPDDQQSAGIQIYTYNSDTKAEQYAYGYGTVSTLTISSVPEPSTWAMLALGFAGLGFAGYRARKSVAVPA
jgi:PEP-CTERM motif